MNSQKILRNLEAHFPKKEIKKVRLYHMTDQPERTDEKMMEWKYSKYVNTDLSLLADKIHKVTQRKSNRTNRREKFEVCGFNSKGITVATIAIKQEPERKEIKRESSSMELISSLMGFTERGYDRLSGSLIRQGNAQKDLIDSYNKKVSSLERRESILAEVESGYREIYAERERKLRREDQAVKMIETFAKHLAPTFAPAMVEKIFTTDRAPQKQVDKTGTENKETEKTPTNKTDKPKSR